MSISADSVTPDGRSLVRSPGMLGELFTFAFIGVAAALSFVWTSGLMVETVRSAPSWVVSAGCYALFILPVYFLHRRFSFRSVAPHRRALPRYIVTQLSGLALASVFSFVAYGVFAVPTTVAALLVIGLTSAVNFVVLRAWAFVAP